jgi:hypothetical protein
MTIHWAARYRAQPASCASSTVRQGAPCIKAPRFPLTLVKQFATARSRSLCLQRHTELLQNTRDNLCGRESPVTVVGSLAPKVCQQGHERLPQPAECLHREWNDAEAAGGGLRAALTLSWKKIT